MKGQFQFTERSFAARNTYNCHRDHYLQNNLKNVRMSSGRDNFKLHDLKPAFCDLESSRIISPIATEGALVGLIPPNKAPSHPEWNLKHYKSVEFCWILECQTPLHKREAFYRRSSGDGSAYNCLPPTSELYKAPKLSHVDFSFSRSEPFHKAFAIEQNAKFGQKKLALNKTNKSCSWHKIFFSTGTATILTANFSRTS